MKKMYYLSLSAIIFILLSINHRIYSQSTYSTELVDLCQGSPPVVWNGNSVFTDKDSVYTATLVNIAGYDSIVSLIVTIIPSTLTIKDTTIIKGSSSFEWNGFIISDQIDSVYSLTLTNQYGCDSTVLLSVTIYEDLESSPYIRCLPNYTVQLGSNLTYSLNWEMIVDSVCDAGIDTIILDNYQLDCDNIGLTTITATAYDTVGNFSSCNTEIIVYGNTLPIVQKDTAYTEMGISIDIMVTSNDYDLNSNLNLSSLDLVSGPSHGSVSMDNSTGIFTYTPDPDYIGTDNFRYSICDDGVPCIPMCGGAEVLVYIGNLTKVSAHLKSKTNFNIYPNPNQGEFKIEFAGLDQQSLLIVADEVGKIILKRDISIEMSSKLMDIDISEYASGTYNIILLNENQNVSKSFIYVDN